MKRFLIMGAILFASASHAQAIECSADLPSVRSGYWSYRIVDGRKCWYEGRRMISKSLLHWSKQPTNDAQAKNAKPKTEAEPKIANAQPKIISARAKITNAQAKMPAADRADFTDPEDGSCCWPPPSNNDNFESRWRALLKLDRE
jgi:hypothetical protein